MRYRDLARREPIEALLCATLESFWSAYLEREIDVSATPSNGTERWSLQPLVSAFLPASSSRRARRFAADTFRWTRRPTRTLPQWMLGTALSSRAGLAVAPVRIHVSSSVSQHGDWVVIPGNQRVRLFELDAGRTWTVTKTGYSAAGQDAEATVRALPNVPGLPVLERRSDEPAWLEEPLVRGWALPRCPPWRSYRRELATATEALRRFQSATCEATALDQYVAERVPLSRRVIGKRATTSLVNLLSPSSESLGLVWSHGDLQPGNIMVRRHGDPVLIDWEYAARRSVYYDALCLSLDGHHRQGLGDRLAAWALDGAPTIEDPAAETLGGRRAAALYLLEDATWIARDVERSPREPGATPASLRVEALRFLNHAQ